MLQTADIAVPIDPRNSQDERLKQFFQGPLRPEEKDLERACVDAIIKSTLSASTSFTSSGCSTPMNLSSVLNADKASFASKIALQSHGLACKKPPLRFSRKHGAGVNPSGPLWSRLRGLWRWVKS